MSTDDKKVDVVDLARHLSTLSPARLAVARRLVDALGRDREFAESWRSNRQLLKQLFWGDARDLNTLDRWIRRHTLKVVK